MANDASQPLVVAVVLTWNDYDMAHDCIASVYRNDYPNLKVVLVDNGSKFDVVGPMGEAFPELTIVALDRNYGFTGGCNRGLEKALELGADYLFLLNNDTIVAENAVTELVKAAEALPECGMASALLLHVGEPKRVFSYRRFLNPDRAHVSKEDDGVELDETRHRDTVETEFAPACAVMYRRAAVEQVGLFDESLFTNWEDYDLCQRLRLAGWKLHFVGKAEVIHAHGATTGRVSPFITYLGTRNRLICLFRYGSLLGILKNTPFILRSFIWQMRAYGWGNMKCHAAWLKAWVHFLLGRRGQSGTPMDRSDSVTGEKQ